MVVLLFHSLLGIESFTTRIVCQMRRFFASKNDFLRRYFDFCVEILRRKSPEKIAKKVCDARIASKIRRKIYVASFIFDAIKKNTNLLKSKIMRRKNDANSKNASIG